MDLQAETAVIEAKLAFPSREELRPHLHKLVANPGSIVMIAVEIRAGDPWVGFAWFNSKERNALRKALLAAREKRKETSTDQEVK
jgi:hypothetical protein